MERPEGLHHLQLKPPTGLLNKKKTLISLMWMRNNHSWPTQGLINMMKQHLRQIKEPSPTREELVVKQDDQEVRK
eukprot:3198652-Prorocentrum_lima.AAC.1